MFVSAGSIILLLTTCSFQIQPSTQVHRKYLCVAKCELKLILNSFQLMFNFCNKVTETKLLRYECNTSGVTVSYIKCRARSVSRNLQVADIEYEVKKDVHELKVDRVKHNK